MNFQDQIINNAQDQIINNVKAGYYVDEDGDYWTNSDQPLNVERLRYLLESSVLEAFAGIATPESVEEYSREFVAEYLLSLKVELTEDAADHWPGISIEGVIDDFCRLVKGSNFRVSSSGNSIAVGIPGVDINSGPRGFSFSF